MKKRLYFYLFLLLFLFGNMIGCGKEKKDGQQVVLYPVTNEVIGVIQDGTLSDHSLVLNITNNSDNCMYQFGQGGEIIEKKVDGQWQEVEPIRDIDASHDALYEVRPKDTVEYHTGWINKYGNLPSGNYRLKKDITKILEYTTIEKYCFYVEFSL